MAKSAHPLRRIASSLQDMRERHRERHRPTGLGFVFADRVGYLDPEKWDQVTAGASLFLRRAVLQVIEKHGPENIRPRYVMVFRDEKPVAALAVQVVSLTGERMQPIQPRGGGLFTRVLAPATRAATAGLKERMLVAGNLLSWGFHGVAFAPGEDPSGLWPAVAEALYRVRRSERLMGQTNLVMVKDVTAEHTGVDLMRRFSYRPMETQPNMVLPIDPSWRTYEDYLAALDAKYRRNARDQAKKLAAAGCVIEAVSDLGACSRRLHELYLEVHSNAPVRMVTLPDTFLPAFARAAADAFRCSIIRRGERILGFVTTVRDGETAIAYYIGFDREAAATGLPLYLQLLHATVNDAIGWGCKRLSLGRTALEPKAALGAKPEPMSVWLRHRVPALNWALRGLLGAVPHAEAPERNPFKAAK
jgi:hypothetical protein